MTWVLILAMTWLAIALVLGTLLGRAIRQADQRDEVKTGPLPRRSKMYGNTVHETAPTDAGSDDESRRRAAS